MGDTADICTVRGIGQWDVVISRRLLWSNIKPRDY